jgi:hypothetical protein
MISPRFLVVSRGPAETMHFDIVVAGNEALAADKVRHTRKGSKVAAKEKGRAPIVLSLKDVKDIASAMEWKADDLVERKFRCLLKTS